MSHRLVCIKNTTNHQILVKQEAGDIILPPRCQLTDIEVINLNELKESGAYIKVNLGEVGRISHKKVLID